MTRRNPVEALPGIGLDAVASPILVFRDGHLSWANAGARDELDVVAGGPANGAGFAGRLLPEDQTEFAAALSASQAGDAVPPIVVSWGPRPVRLLELAFVRAGSSTVVTVHDVTEEARLNAVASVLAGGVLVLDEHLVTRWAAHRTAQRLTVSTDELTGLDMRQLIHPEDRARFERAAEEMRATPATVTHFYARVRAPNTDVYWPMQLWLSYQPQEPTIDGFVLRCTAHYDRVDDNDYVMSLLSASDGTNAAGAVFFSADGLELFRSPSAVQLLGGESADGSFTGLVGEVRADHRKAFRDAARSARSGAGRGWAIVAVERSGTCRWLRVETSPALGAEGRVTGWVASLLDVTTETEARRELEATQERLRLLTDTDALTGLPNRTLFMRHLAEAWARHQTTGESVALLVCDLNDFKAVNGAFGNDAGDLVLKTISARISESVRETDFVARLGGNEFAVVCECYGDDSTLDVIASRVRQAIETPVLVSAGSAKVAVSIGLRTTADLTDSAHALLAGAHRAMWEARTGARTAPGRNPASHGTGTADGAQSASASADGPAPPSFALPASMEVAGPAATVHTDVSARPVVERSGIATIVFNVDGLITSWSDGAEQAYGFPAEEMLGRPAVDLVPDAHATDLLGAIARAGAGEELFGVRSFRRTKHGAPMEVTVDLAPVPQAVIRPGMIPRVPPPLPVPAGTSLGDIAADLFQLLPGVIFRTDPTGVVQFCAGQGLAEPGVTPADMIGLSLLDVCEDDVSAGNVLRLLAGRPGEGPCSIGGRMWNYACTPVRDDTGAIVAIDGTLTDTRGVWDDREAVARSEARFRSLVQNSSDLVAMLDVDLNITYVSPSALRLLGWQPTGMYGTNLTAYVNPGDLKVLTRGLTFTGGRAPTSAFDVRLRTADGAWRVYEVVSSNLVDDRSVGAIVINGRDVTDRRAADAELRHRATHDHLTDLPNRASLLERVDLLLRPDGHVTAAIGIVVLGLDRFRLVNDSLGHGTGDQLLMAVATRLRRAVRPTDIVARLGGDTFVVAGRRVGDATLGRALAERLLASLEEPFEIDGSSLNVSASAGVALSDGRRDANALVQDADTAMHVAKQPGCPSIQLFEPSLRRRSARHLDLEQSLRHVVERQQLRVHYQPIVRLEDAQPVGVEALVRWEHPELGLVPPLDFIPLAEETGDIVAIGAWVLEEASRTVAAWNVAGHDLHLAVNVSPRQLLDGDLPAFVFETINRCGLPADKLTLEVTESVLVDEGGASKLALTTLAERGVRLAIDDFGTGYSSLLYLRRLKVDTLKIDRSFVDGLGSDTEDDAIVDTIIGLAGTLGLNIVAEGVENDTQRRILLAKGCVVAQGYHFARPLTVPQFEEAYGAPAHRPPGDGDGLHV